MTNSATKSSPIAAFILAGGKSSRMGRDKALLEIARMPMISRAVRLAESVAATAIVVGAPDTFREFGFTVLADDFPGDGPLGGIATALRASSKDWNLMLACDLPYMTADWLRYLAQRAQASAKDVVIPVSDRGFEPLCAIYRKSCEATIREAVKNGRLKVQDAIAVLRTQARVETVEPAEWKAFDSEGLLFKNMNSPLDYEEAKARIGGRAIL